MSETRLMPLKILLAEDDANIAMIIRLCLERIGGHTVTVVEDGQAATETALAQATSFDLVILDGMMPKRTGVQVAQDLRAAGLTTPIIFLSAKAESHEYTLYGTGFIAKPFEPTTICQSIDSILSRKSA
jgi:DNA-binding response OmpR family regulator